MEGPIPAITTENVDITKGNKGTLFNKILGAGEEITNEAELEGIINLELSLESLDLKSKNADGKDILYINSPKLAAASRNSYQNINLSTIAAVLTQQTLRLSRALSFTDDIKISEKESETFALALLTAKLIRKEKEYEAFAMTLSAAFTLASAGLQLGMTVYSSAGLLKSTAKPGKAAIKPEATQKSAQMQHTLANKESIKLGKTASAKKTGKKAQKKSENDTRVSETTKTEKAEIVEKIESESIKTEPTAKAASDPKSVGAPQKAETGADAGAETPAAKPKQEAIKDTHQASKTEDTQVQKVEATKTTKQLDNKAKLVKESPTTQESIKEPIKGAKADSTAVPGRTEAGIPKPDTAAGKAEASPNQGTPIRKKALDVQQANPEGTQASPTAKNTTPSSVKKTVESDLAKAGQHTTPKTSPSDSNKPTTRKANGGQVKQGGNDKPTLSEVRKANKAEDRESRIVKHRNNQFQSGIQILSQLGQVASSASQAVIGFKKAEVQHDRMMMQAFEQGSAELGNELEKSKREIEDFYTTTIERLNNFERQQQKTNSDRFRNMII